jgi:plastin-1
LDSEKCTLEALSEADDIKRAELMLLNVEALGGEKMMDAEDFMKGNNKANIIFIAEVFNTNHGLNKLEQEEKEAYETATMDDDDIEGSREERAFRLWINSLGIEDVFIQNLYQECRTGMVLLKVIHKIDNTVVEWNRVEKNANNTFKIGINCQVAFDACEKLKLKLVGIGAQDIRDGHKKLTLAIVWQLVRAHYLQIIGSRTEQDLIKWANSSVKDMQIDNFRDKKLADGRFLIKLCASIEPRIVNWELVNGGETDEEKAQNAKYAISIARKLGCVIFMVWDDVLEVNQKMILVFIASLYDLNNQFACYV